MVHKSTKDPYVRFWIEDGVEVAMCTAADFREAMNERDRLRTALNDLLALIKGVDAEANNVQLDIARVLRRHHLTLDRDKDG